jgi:hypothetical protein
MALASLSPSLGRPNSGAPAANDDRRRIRERRDERIEIFMSAAKGRSIPATGCLPPPRPRLPGSKLEARYTALGYSLQISRTRSSEAGRACVLATRSPRSARSQYSLDSRGQVRRPRKREKRRALARPSRMSFRLSLENGITVSCRASLVPRGASRIHGLVEDVRRAVCWFLAHRTIPHCAQSSSSSERPERPFLPTAGRHRSLACTRHAPRKLRED